MFSLILFSFTSYVGSLLNFLFQVPEFDTLTAVLLWIVAAGGAMWIAGKVKARFLENLVFWHNLSPRVKKITTIVLAGLIAIAAEVLIAIDIGEIIPAWLATVILTLVNWYYGQSEYQGIKDSRYADSTRMAAANKR